MALSRKTADARAKKNRRQAGAQGRRHGLPKKKFLPPENPVQRLKK
jgi:hypothetical protein